MQDGSLLNSKNYPTLCDVSQSIVFPILIYFILPGLIWEQGRHAHYIKKINGEWVIVRVYFGGDVWTVSTAVVESTKSGVRQYINEPWNLNDRIYGPPLNEV